MGVIDRIKNIFRRKRPEPIPEIVPEPAIPARDVINESAVEENVKAKMDSVMIQLDTLNTRIEQIERMLKEIYVIAKRSQ